MGEADLSGLRDLSPSDQTRIGDRVVRVAKRPGDDEGAVLGDQPHHAVDFCGFKALLEIHIRQNRGKAFSKHGLPRAGGTDHNDVVATRSGHFEAAFHMLLTLAPVDRTTTFCPKASPPSMLSLRP